MKEQRKENREEYNEMKMPKKTTADKTENTTVRNESEGRRSHCGVMAKERDCNIAVSEFDLPSCNYVHFWT